MNVLEALHPHPEDHLHLRLHRARSVILTSQELVEIRAAQRTFEGAYMRTAISQFSFSLIIFRIFTSEFYPIGALFAVFGAAIMIVSIHRRYEGNRQFFDQEVSVDGDCNDGHHDAAAVPATLDPGRLSPAPARSSYRRSVVVKKFRTSANSVALMVALSLCAYLSLIVLIWNLKT